MRDNRLLAVLIVDRLHVLRNDVVLARLLQDALTRWLVRVVPRLANLLHR